MELWVREKKEAWSNLRGKDSDGSKIVVGLAKLSEATGGTVERWSSSGKLIGRYRVARRWLDEQSSLRLVHERTIRQRFESRLSFPPHQKETQWSSNVY